MKKRVLKKEFLDEAGAILLKSAQKTDAEIENIVNKPQIFDSIAAKIAAEKANRDKKRSRRRFSPKFNFFVTGATVTAMVLIIAAIVFYNRPNDSGKQQFAQNESVIKPQTAEFSGEKSFSPSAEPKQIVKVSTQTAKTVQRNPNSSRQNKPSKTLNARKSSTMPEVLPAKETYADEGIFYALPFADDSGGDDFTQIVRAGLSRAELSALGIELPLAENDDDEKILTDLIYGSNGNPKAFRLIGKL